MSFASSLNADKIFEPSNIETSNEINTKSTYAMGDTSFSHLIDSSGNFHIQNNSGAIKLLSFDNSNNLLDCAVKTHVANQVAPINRTLTNHTLTLTDHETRVTNLENSGGQEIGLQSLDSVLAAGNDASNQSIDNVSSISCNGNVTASNITSMQSQIVALQNYNTALKSLILSISRSLTLQKPDNSGAFDYTTLLA